MYMETIVYEAPQIEIIEVEVERGFATSSTSINGGMGESTGIGGNGTITGGGYD